jgi:hypothetical protein
VNRREVCGGLAALVILWGAMGHVAAAPGSLAARPSNIHPAVAQRVKQNPAEMIRLIVQVHPGSPGPFEAVAGLGGRVKASWPFIHGFAVELPASRVAALAAVPGVRAVLPDHARSQRGQIRPMTSTVMALTWPASSG